MPNGEIITQNFEYPVVAGMPISGQYLLLDDVAAADVGIWMRWPFVKGTMEVDGTFSGGEVKLMMSGAQEMPANGFTIQAGGTETTDDILTINLTCPALINGGISATYKVLGGDDSNDVAAGLAAALVAALRVASQIYSNPIEQALAAAALQVSVSTDTITVIWTQPLPPVTLQTDVGGAATETLTVAQYDSGEGYLVDGCDVNAAGQVVFEQAGQWIKAVAVTVGSGSLSCIVNGSAP